jgi:hypothetical protein
MLKQISRKLAIGVIVGALATPVAFAGNSPIGTDPDPGPDPPNVIHVVLALLGLA